jgi:hypothetical protein
VRRWLIAGLLLTGLWGQPARSPEPLGAWLYYKEVRVPAGNPGLADFVLDRDSLNGARADQADLRLYDQDRREIPYALRILRGNETFEALPAREFNRGVQGGASEVSLDLGEGTQEHNRAEIDTEGNNFRRQVAVDGSQDAVHWSTLAQGATLFRFTTNGGGAYQDWVGYPVSRYRYLRVRVSPDPQMDRTPPGITGVRIRRMVQRRGERVQFEAKVEGREADRVDARPASIWRLDLGGRVPLDQLAIAVAETGFSRPYRLEDVDDPGRSQFLTSGELMHGQATIPFSEHIAGRLKLTIIDDRNAPLTITSVTASGAARQVVFESGAAGVRLYYGNPKALAPRYDFSARLPVEVQAARAALGPQVDNPGYRAEEKPFSERSPWLIYVVLGVASAVLAVILIGIARSAIKPRP